MMKHVIDIGWTSIRLSVRHTLVLYQNGPTAEHIVMLSLPQHDSPFILVLCISRSLRNSDDDDNDDDGVTPAGPLNRGGV